MSEPVDSNSTADAVTRPERPRHHCQRPAHVPSPRTSPPSTHPDRRDDAAPAPQSARCTRAQIGEWQAPLGAGQFEHGLMGERIDHLGETRSWDIRRWTPLLQA